MCRLRRAAFAAVYFPLLLTLAACGGGSSGGGGGGIPPPPLPIVTLTASDPAVSEGSSTQLTWSTTNALGCTASDGWVGVRTASGSESTGSLLTTTTFTLSCTGAGGTGSASVTVTVHPFPTATLVANPPFVRTGTTSELVWSSTNATACAASRDWSGPRPLGGSETVGPLTQSAVYTLICTGPGGSAERSADIAFRPGVNQIPIVHAGSDQVAFSSATVQLAAGVSDDGLVVDIHWTQIAGPPVALSEQVPFHPTFVAPMVASNAVLTFSATVTDDEGAVSAPDTVDVTVQPVPPQVRITGQITYENVPFGFAGTGLDYNGQRFEFLTAEVLIEAVDASTQTVLASGRFRAQYDLMVPSVTDMVLRATAEMSRQAPLPLPHWQISVRDLDEATAAPLGPIYSYTVPVFNSAAGGPHNISIPSGWNNSGQLVGARSAAPFAILDAIRAGMTTVLDVLPVADFPPLTIDWSPGNPGGTTFFSAGTQRIVLSGEIDVDTDEYDQPVILHEFGHYIDRAFSRSDSLGGAHSFGERVDLRVAFGEGLATAFSSIARNDPVYRDSFGLHQGNTGFINIESDSPVNEGWYSETSTQELLWDVFDSFGSDSGNDTIGLGFVPIWNVWHGTAHSQTDAAISIFTFMSDLKQTRPAEAGAIDTLLTREQIVGPTMDIFGSTETNDAGSLNVLPVYGSIALGGTVQVRSVSEFGVGNKLSTHRLLRFNLGAPTNVRFVVSAAAGRDPDIQIFRRGARLAPVMGPSNEDFTLSLAGGDYVLDVFDCGNADCNDDVSPAVTDITVSVTPN